MAIIATGSKTIIDMSDGKSLSVYLTSNQPKTQIYDVNNSSYTPDWTTTAGKLVITPVVYANQTQIPLTDSNMTITWKRKEGSGNETTMTSNQAETISGNVLTVTANKISSIASGMLTYLAYVSYLDPETGLTIQAVADITYAMVKTGADASTAFIDGEQVFRYAKENGVISTTPSPTSITLTANLQNCTVTQWQYKDGNSYKPYPTGDGNPTNSATT